MAAATISKMDAVRKAIRELGKDAMPGKIQEFVKDKFGLEMTMAHVSNYKSVISKKKKKGKKAAALAPAASASAPAPMKPAPAVAKLTLSDIEAVKKLVGRVGEENLKSLVGLLG
jgi:hypothetical protein